MIFRVIVEFKNDERILSSKEKICEQFYLIGCASEIISRNSIKQRLKDKLYSIQYNKCNLQSSYIPT